MTQPPGCGNSTLPHRAKMGPTSTIDARKRLEMWRSNVVVMFPPAEIAYVLFSCFATEAPRFSRSSHIRWTSSISGTSCRVTLSSKSVVAASTLRIAFFAPPTEILPSNFFSQASPLTKKLSFMPKFYGLSCVFTNQQRKKASSEPRRSICYALEDEAHPCYPHFSRHDEGPLVLLFAGESAGRRDCLGPHSQQALLGDCRRSREHQRREEPPAPIAFPY